LEVIKTSEVSSTGKTGVQGLMMSMFIGFIEIDFSVEKFINRNSRLLQNM
jgi:hypothetical protein